MKHLTDDILEEIQHEIKSTMVSLASIIEKHELEADENELEDRLLDGAHPVERSKCCEWWFAVSDLEFDEEKNGGVCQACEPDEF